MNIILDSIIFSLQKSGGISILWQNLIEGLSKYKDINLEYIEYANAEENIFRKGLYIPPEKIHLNTNRFFKIKRYLSPLIKNKEFFIFHSSYYRIVKSRNSINITTVHDFTYERYFPKIKRIIHSWQKFKAIRNSDIIVCISENTKKDLIRYIPDIDVSKLRIIYNGVSNDYYPLDSKPYPELRNSIMFVGSRLNYKNFDYTISCIKDTNYNLIICGKKLTAKEQIKLDSTLGPKRYQLIVNPDNTQLNKIYNSVFCLSYPSSYEGFGIPVIEAQKAGCPVIALNQSSIPEIIGLGYPMLNKLSVQSFHEIIQILENQKSRDRIIRQGLINASKYSWERMVGEYVDLYREVEAHFDK